MWMQGGGGSWPSDVHLVLQAASLRSWSYIVPGWQVLTCVAYLTALLLVCVPRPLLMLWCLRRRTAALQQQKQQPSWAHLAAQSLLQVLQLLSPLPVLVATLQPSSWQLAAVQAVQQLVWTWPRGR
jgi:hypothetical protein